MSPVRPLPTGRPCTPWGTPSAIAALTDLGLAAAVRIDGERALISLRLPGGLDPTAESTCQTLLTGMMVYLTELHGEYPDFIEVLEAE